MRSPSVTEGAWPAEALAITEAGCTALAKHRAEIAGKKVGIVQATKG
jgi:hypothetical protein